MQISEILNHVPDKRIDKNTTSLQFKHDIIDFFMPLQLKQCVEIGTSLGYSTYILSHIFEHVTTIDIHLENLTKAQEFNKDRKNISYLLGDSGESDWDQNTLFNVAFIDANHRYPYVMKDTMKSIQFGTENMYIIFDDYGLPEPAPAVKVAVDELLNNNTLKFVKYIGEPKGNEPRIGKPLVDWEGIITQVNIK
jgi:hypothetical protein